MEFPLLYQDEHLRQLLLQYIVGELWCHIVSVELSCSVLQVIYGGSRVIPDVMEA